MISTLSLKVGSFQVTSVAASPSDSWTENDLGHPKTFGDSLSDKMIYDIVWFEKFSNL